MMHLKVSARSISLGLAFIPLLTLAADLIRPQMTYGMGTRSVYSQPTSTPSSPPEARGTEEKERVRPLEDLEPIIYEYLTSVNQIYISKKNSPEELWAMLSSSRAYKAGKFITKVTGVCLANAYLFLPYLQEFLKYSWQFYDYSMGCSQSLSQGATADRLEFMEPTSIFCHSATRLAAGVLIAVPSVICLNTQRERLARVIDEGSDQCMQAAIRAIQQCRGYIDPKKMSDLEDTVTGLSKKLSARGSELVQLPLKTRQVIFHAAAVSGQVALMRSVLRPSDVSEKRILDFLSNIGERDCSVCLEGFEGQKRPFERVVESGCKHYFHESCLKTWHQRRTSDGGEPDCPLCRTKESETEGSRYVQGHWPLERH